MNKTTKWYAKPLYAIMALALVAGLTLVPVMVPALAPVAGPTAEANTVSDITVWSRNYTPAAEANYTINFTTTVNLTKDVDTITIDFPNFIGVSGTNTSLNNITAAKTWVNGTAATSVTTGGTRLSITPSVNVTAGNVTVMIGNSTTPDEIINPSPQGNYTLTVHTSQEPTPVTSANYMIDTMITVGTVVIANTSVNTLSQYTIPITVTTALAQYDTITIVFPNLTTVPTSINAGANITINGTSLTSIANYTGNNTTKTVTIDVPAAPGTDEWDLVFTQGALLKNPITVNSSWWYIWAYTSKDRGANVSANYTTTRGNQSQITQCNWSSHDDYIANNTCGGTSFSIETLDVNGALCNVTASTTFTLTAGDGSFYSNNDCSTAIGTIAIAANNGNSSGFWYKCTTPGTQNISARDLNGSWTRDNFSVTVNPMVQLWGGGVLVENYKTLALAEAAALPYDTIKVLPSTYGLSATLIINVPHLTIESTGGADSTIIYGESGSAAATVIFRVDTNNVTVDGLTFKGDNGTAAEDGIDFKYGGFTIQNCKFIDIMNDNIMIEPSADITSGLIHNNTLIGNGTGFGSYRAGILVETYSSDIYNVTISNNTLSNFGAKNSTACLASGIKVAETTGNLYNVTITGNTFTDCYAGLTTYNSISDLNGNKSIANNTFSGCLAGVWVTGGDNPNVPNFTLQNNTMTNNTYGIWVNEESSTQALTAAAVTVTHNDLSGNDEWGICNAYDDVNSVPVASYNYWGGNETGPGAGNGTYASNATGSGSNVSINVTYSPWLDAPYPGGNTTYASSITLQLDWNFISVPKTLSNPTFGFLLSGQNISASYSYDPGTGWTLLTSSSPVAVLDAYWVDANAAGTINLTYVITGQEVPASKDLTGDKWNAVGFSNITAATTNTTLRSVVGSWSTVLGWNDTAQDYDPAMIYQVNCDSGNNMNPGKGYWVWMTANDTLCALS